MTQYCPYCGSICYGEEPHHQGYFFFECECGKMFNYDEYRSEYYDNDGNIINTKGGK